MTATGESAPAKPVLEPRSSALKLGSAEQHAGWAKLCNLQRRILPQVAPTVSGYRLFFAYSPAFIVTGDYHDFFRRPDGSTAAFLGDGSGHGPAASMLMAIVRTIFHTHDVYYDPGTTLNRVGAMLILNLGLIDLFPSAFYRLLLQTLHDMRSIGGRVLVCCLNDNAREGFQIMGGTRTFECFNSEAKALAAARK